MDVVDLKKRNINVYKIRMGLYGCSGSKKEYIHFYDINFVIIPYKKRK